MSLELFLDKINNICESLAIMIRDNNEGYDTGSAIYNLEIVFNKCANDLYVTISDSSERLQAKLYNEIMGLCDKLLFNVIEPIVQVQSRPDEEPRVFFIGVEKHNISGISNVDSHSLKLFDNFVNSIIDGIFKQNIIMEPLMTMVTTRPSKRLILFLNNIGTAYRNLMTKNNIPLVRLEPGLELELLANLSKDMYKTLPYVLNEENLKLLNGGGKKSRRIHRRHRKSKSVRKTRCVRKSKSKPKTHRRRSARSSRIRKHKKHTSHMG
jgi:hypothetical protein